MKIIVSACKADNAKDIYPITFDKWKVSSESIVSIDTLEKLQEFIGDISNEADWYVDGVVIWANREATNDYQMVLAIHDSYIE